jgi:hypothetical protein
MQRSIRPFLRYLAIIGLEIVWLFAVPPTLISGYLWISTYPRRLPPATDFIALAFSTLVGSLGIWALPISGIRRVILFLPYASVMTIFLYLLMSTDL